MATTPNDDSAIDEHDRDTLPGAPRSEGVPTGVYVSPKLTSDEGGRVEGARLVDESGAEPKSESAPIAPHPTWVDVARGLARNADAVIRRELTEHPYRSLAIAAAAGFAIRNARAARVVALLGARVALDALTTSAAGSAA